MTKNFLKLSINSSIYFYFKQINKCNSTSVSVILIVFHVHDNDQRNKEHPQLDKIFIGSIAQFAIAGVTFRIFVVCHVISTKINPYFSYATTAIIFFVIRRIYEKKKMLISISRFKSTNSLVGDGFLITVDLRGLIVLTCIEEECFNNSHKK